MKNLGKIFEDNWRKSVPEDFFYYRFRDSSGGWAGNDKIRFTPSNIADCMLFAYNELFLIELKNHKGKSIPMDAVVGNKTKEKQIQDLLNAGSYCGIYCYIVIFFSDVEECYAIPIDKFREFQVCEERKSIPISWCKENVSQIGVTKLRSNYKYNIEKWIAEEKEKRA